MTYPPQSPHSYLAAEGDGVVVVEPGNPLTILVDDAESSAVKRAGAALARDIHDVTGVQATVTAGGPSHRLIVGTIGVCSAIDDAIADGRVDIAPLLDALGSPRWEGFLVTVSGPTVYLIGADRRGTIYAAYDFAESIGVSPWRWWGDVVVRPRDRIVVRADAAHADWPSVRYRGVFLNDEEELFHWARAHTADGTIGPQTYERVFELLLRLKGNYLWPAMHVGAFNHDDENGRLADEMGIVIGTSHCDMLLRSNEHEFHPWVAARGEDVRYDYSLPGRNREMLQEYWRGSIAQNRDYEVTWTVGIRGVHDSGFETAAIDEDESLTEHEKFTARVRLLEQAIHDQRALLAAGLGVPATDAPQLFVPYKEVLPLYDAGLRIPDDVTLVWANDNFGYIRRFPSPDELRRSGGHGLYYHSSYWSNYTTSYLATSTAPLALMCAELEKAWDRGIRHLWVDNVGGLKPLELEMTYFLRRGWEAASPASTSDVRAFTAEWIDSMFSGGHGAAAAAIYMAHSRINQHRKIEHLEADVFSQTAYGNEASRRLTELQRLYTATNEILHALPAAERDAFFQLFAVKIHMTYLTNGEFVYADRSTLAAEQGKGAAADAYLAVSRAFADSRRALIHFYNRIMSDGKWDGMFTPEAFPPPVLPLHAAGTPSLLLGHSDLGVTVWGDEWASRRVDFHPFGIAEKWIEVFPTGAAPVGFEIEADPWIEVSPRAGVAHTESRVAVRISPSAAGAPRSGSLTVRVPETGRTITVEVRLLPPLDLGDFAGAVEGDGFISIDPADPAVAEVGNASWGVVEHLGRDGDHALRARTQAGVAAASVATYPFFLVTAGDHHLELHRLPTLDSTGRIRVGVGIDGAPPIIVESETTDEHRGAWSHGIKDNVERLRVRLPRLSAGAHTLDLHVVDAGVTLTKLVLYTAEPLTTSLGPPFSRHTPQGGPVPPGASELHEALIELADVTREVYRVNAEEVPLPHQLYADRHFWEGATTFRPARAIMQIPRAAMDGDRPPAAKDVVANLGSGRIVESQGVMAFEAEYALAADGDAWSTLSVDGHGWTHTQAETNARTGLAMHTRPRGVTWADPLTAPGLHFSLDVGAAGSYRVWLLLKFQDDHDDSCVIALDGVAQPVEEQFSSGDLCTYGARQAWLWAHLSDLEIAAGHHTFSVLARESGLRVDRIYLTLGDELPPIDSLWTPSPRADTVEAPVEALPHALGTVS